MVGYVALHWSEAVAPSALEPLRAVLARQSDWRIAVDVDSLLLAVRGPAWPRVRRLPAGRGWVVGDLFSRTFRPVADDEADYLMISQACPALEVAERLRDTYWGRYVALIDPRRAAGGVYRDPSGAVDALTWRGGGVSITAAQCPAWMPPGLVPAVTFDWPEIGRWLVDGSAPAVRSGLRSVRSVTPGAFAAFAGGERQVWRPSDYAQRPSVSAADAAAALPDLLDQCVAAAIADAAGIAAEISGGLDSAILASSLAPAGGERVRHWFNYHAAEGSGDERAFARDVAARWGVRLTEVFRAPFRYDADLLEGGAFGLRPGFQAFDAAADIDLARRLAEAGCDRIVSGQGGDMTLFNIPTAVVVADHLRAKGLRGLSSPYVADVARWTRQSVWRTLGQALKPGAAWWGEAKLHDHPWMAGTAGLPPGKRAHIAIIAQKLTAHIENRRSRQAEILTPFLFQPIVEHCLAVPVPDLTAGGRERALARRAFAARLPVSVLERREKGEFSAFYHRVIADSLPFLRGYLLDGELAGAGLIDTDRFDRLLTVENLIWHADSAPIMAAATAEAWVRCWRRRGGGSSPAS